MKIISPRNNKDYYDYLTGVYGIDEKVVYDRRQYTVLAGVDSPFFSRITTEKDAPKKMVRTREWVDRHYKFVTKYVAHEMHCMLEVGLKWYFFRVERYLDESSNVCIDWEIEQVKKITKSQRLSAEPMSFYNAYVTYHW